MNIEMYPEMHEILEELGGNDADDLISLCDSLEWCEYPLCIEVINFSAGRDANLSYWPGDPPEPPEWELEVSTHGEDFFDEFVERVQVDFEQTVGQTDMFWRSVFTYWKRRFKLWRNKSRIITTVDAAIESMLCSRESDDLVWEAYKDLCDYDYDEPDYDYGR